MPRPQRCWRICEILKADTICPNICRKAGPILLTVDE